MTTTSPRLQGIVWDHMESESLSSPLVERLAKTNLWQAVDGAPHCCPRLLRPVPSDRPCSTCAASEALHSSTLPTVLWVHREGYRTPLEFAEQFAVNLLPDQVLAAVLFSRRSQCLNEPALVSVRSASQQARRLLVLSFWPRVESFDFTRLSDACEHLGYALLACRDVGPETLISRLADVMTATEGRPGAYSSFFGIERDDHRLSFLCWQLFQNGLEEAALKCIGETYRLPELRKALARARPADIHALLAIRHGDYELPLDLQSRWDLKAHDDGSPFEAQRSRDVEEWIINWQHRAQTLGLGPRWPLVIETMKREAIRWSPRS